MAFAFDDFRARPMNAMFEEVYRHRLPRIGAEKYLI